MSSGASILALLKAELSSSFNRIPVKGRDAVPADFYRDPNNLWIMDHICRL